MSALEPTPPETQPLPLPTARRRGVSRLQELGLLLVIVLFVAGLGLYGWHDARPGRPNTFLNADNLVDGIATPMSYYAIMAVGMTLVIITGGIDISVASVMALSGLITAWLLSRLFPPMAQNVAADSPAWQVLLPAILVPAAVGLVCGLINGVAVVGLRLHPFIVTLGTLGIFRCICNVLPFGEKTLPARGAALPSAFIGGFMQWTVLGIQPMPLIIMVLCVAAGWVYLHRMVAGRQTYAVGGNEEAARFSGLPVGWIKLRAYALCGLAAGIAGMVSLGRFGTISTSTGLGYELTVVAAAVVGGASLSGGRGTALGALLGTLVLALIEDAISILHLDQDFRLGIVGLAIIAAAALDRFSDYLRQRRLVAQASRL